MVMWMKETTADIRFWVFVWSVARFQISSKATLPLILYVILIGFPKAFSQR